MTLLTNAKHTYESKGLREDLSNVISNLSPDECPLYAGAGRAVASSTLTEWQTDTNRAAISHGPHSSPLEPGWPAPSGGWPARRRQGRRIGPSSPVPPDPPEGRPPRR